jgi:hypothetical protein
LLVLDAILLLSDASRFGSFIPRTISDMTSFATHVFSATFKQSVKTRKSANTPGFFPLGPLRHDTSILSHETHQCRHSFLLTGIVYFPDSRIRCKLLSRVGHPRTWWCVALLLRDAVHAILRVTALSSPSCCICFNPLAAMVCTIWFAVCICRRSRGCGYAVATVGPLQYYRAQAMLSWHQGRRTQFWLPWVILPVKLA